MPHACTTKEAKKMDSAHVRCVTPNRAKSRSKWLEAVFYCDAYAQELAQRVKIKGHSGHTRVTEIGIPDILVKNEVTWTCGMAIQSQEHPLQFGGVEILI